MNNKIEGRNNALINIYSNLNNHFATKNIATNKALTYKTFQIINLINKKVK